MSASVVYAMPNRNLAVVADRDFPAPAEIYVGVAGDVSINAWDPQVGAVATVYKNAPAGYVLPCLARRVNSSGTTATDLVANWYK